MVPQALPLIEQAATAKAIPAEERLRLIATMDLALGLDLLGLDRADLRVRPEDASITEEEIEALIADRQVARANKDYAESDRLRDLLAERGVSVMDGADNIRWDWSITL
jgi:cysteinyl-tRNA synthetase